MLNFDTFNFKVEFEKKKKENFEWEIEICERNKKMVHH
jgi:hypothetical protein